MKTRAKDLNEKSTWQEVTTGAEIYEPSTSLLVNTGEWRVMKPVLKNLTNAGSACFVHRSVRTVPSL